jgi:hypothetical protein
MDGMNFDKGLYNRENYIAVFNNAGIGKYGYVKLQSIRDFLNQDEFILEGNKLIKDNAIIKTK